MLENIKMAHMNTNLKLRSKMIVLIVLEKVIC